MSKKTMLGLFFGAVALAVLGLIASLTLKNRITWQLFNSPEAKFSVLFPKSPEVQVQKVSTTVGEVDSQEYRVSLEQGHITYSVGHIGYPDGTIIEAEKAMDGAMLSLVTQFKGVMDLQGQKAITVKNFPGREIVFKGTDVGARVWIVLVGVHHYQVSVSGKQVFVDDKATNEFLSSFQPQP